MQPHLDIDRRKDPEYLLANIERLAAVKISEHTTRENKEITYLKQELSRVKGERYLLKQQLIAMQELRRENFTLRRDLILMARSSPNEVGFEISGRH